MIDYKHLKFWVRMYPSLLGGAKIEWIIAFNSEWRGDWSTKPSLCKLSRLDVCLSELCLLQTSYNCGAGPRGHTLFQYPSSVTVKEKKDFSFIQSTASVVCTIWIMPCVIFLKVYISSADQGSSSFCKTAGSLSGLKRTLLDSSQSQLKPI